MSFFYKYHCNECNLIIYVENQGQLDYENTVPCPVCETEQAHIVKKECELRE